MQKGSAEAVIHLLETTTVKTGRWPRAPPKCPAHCTYLVWTTPTAAPQGLWQPPLGCCPRHPRQTASRTPGHQGTRTHSRAQTNEKMVTRTQGNGSEQASATVTRSHQATRQRTPTAQDGSTTLDAAPAWPPTASSKADSVATAALSISRVSVTSWATSRPSTMAGGSAERGMSTRYGRAA